MSIFSKGPNGITQSGTGSSGGKRRTSPTYLSYCFHLDSLEKAEPHFLQRTFGIMETIVLTLVLVNYPLVPSLLGSHL